MKDTGSLTTSKNKKKLMLRQNLKGKNKETENQKSRRAGGDGHCNGYPDSRSGAKNSGKSVNDAW
jgi:hypothetical protein